MYLDLNNYCFGFDCSSEEFGVLDEIDNYKNSTIIFLVCVEMIGLASAQMIGFPKKYYTKCD